MDVFFKSAAGVLITVVLVLILAKQGKDFSILIVIAACAMIIVAAANYLRPVMELIDRLQSIGQVNSDTMSVMLKATGIGVITEITMLICADSGNAGLGKTLQFLACAVILWLSIPLLNELLGLLENILGAI